RRAPAVGARLQGRLEGRRAGWGELLERLGAGRPDVGQLLLPRGVDVDVLAAGVLADHHALVDLDARSDEELAALLEVDQRVRGGHTGAVGDQRAGAPGADGAGPRRHGRE